MNKKALIIILIVSLGINIGLFGTIAYRAITNRIKPVGPAFHPPEYLPPPPPGHLPPGHQPPGPPGGGSPEMGQPGLPRWLENDSNLSKDQKEKIDRLFTENKETHHSYRKTIDDKRKDLFDLLNKEDPNLEEIDKKIAEVSALELEQQMKVIRHILKIREILTPHQARKLNRYIERHMCPTGGKRGPGRGMGPGEGMGPGGGRNMMERWGDNQPKGENPPETN
jgi:Spy/CpxP family protein refolding chaperone